jgi:hypothetical protein
MFLVYVLLMAVAILLTPSIAYAWGPGAHVEFAMGVIAKMGLIAPIIRPLIKGHAEAFIYGAASPDIVVGKKYAGLLHHCHSWRIGWLILHEAENDLQRSAAYGYLTHLAADVVAHNYYIPFKIVRSYSTRLLAHTYWEMRFDLGVSDEVWDKFKMITELEIREFDSLLEGVLRKTLFSFSTNKKIFNSILMLQKMKGLRESLKAYARCSRFDMVDENRAHYEELAFESVFNFLRNPEKAACLDMDPTGESRMAYAKDLRHRMRMMLQGGYLNDRQAGKLVELVKDSLAMGLYRPDMPLPDVTDVM